VPQLRIDVYLPVHSVLANEHPHDLLLVFHGTNPQIVSIWFSAKNKKPNRLCRIKANKPGIGILCRHQLDSFCWPSSFRIIFIFIFGFSGSSKLITITFGSPFDCTWRMFLTWPQSIFNADGFLRMLLLHFPRNFASVYVCVWGKACHWQSGEKLFGQKFAEN